MEIGIDIEEIDRIKKVHKKWGDKFLDRVFNKEEIDYCFKKNNPYPSLCGRFCAKEAVIKVLDVPVDFKDIKITNLKNGKPVVSIKNKPSDIKISISHSRAYAAVVAVKQ